MALMRPTLLPIITLLLFGCGSEQAFDEFDETGGRGATTAACSTIDGTRVRLVDGGPCLADEKLVCWAGQYAQAPATHVCSSLDGLVVVLRDPPDTCDAAHPKHVCDATP